MSDREVHTDFKEREYPDLFCFPSPGNERASREMQSRNATELRARDAGVMVLAVRLPAGMFQSISFSSPSGNDDCGQFVCTTLERTKPIEKDETTTKAKLSDNQHIYVAPRLLKSHSKTRDRTPFE